MRKNQAEVWQSMPVPQRRRLMNAKTIDAQGNDITHLVEINPRVTEGQARRLEANDELSKHEKEQGGFFMAFYEREATIVNRFPEIQQADYARLLFFGSYAAWETGRLQYDNGVPMKRKQMEELSKMSRNRFGEFYKRLKAAGILEEREDGIYMNPGVVYYGKMASHPFVMTDYGYTRVFRNAIRELYNEFYKNAKQLGVLYAVLPFINFRTSIIAENPTENNPELVEPMLLSRLALALEYEDANKLSRAMRQIRYDGRAAFLFVIDPDRANQRRIIVNPDILFAGNGEELKAVKAIFNQSKRR